MDDRFELSVEVGDVTFRAAGDTRSVMEAFSEFKKIESWTRASESRLPSSTGTDGAPGESDALELSDVPLAVFVKRAWPSQAGKATAIVMWAKHREGRSGLKPGEIETYWRRTPGKTPANPSQVCANAVSQGWLYAEGNGVYSVTGHGEAMVASTPQPA